MAADEWHNNGPQDLITVSLCIKIAIDKMKLCLLSIVYSCPNHNPTATVGHLKNPDVEILGWRDYTGSEVVRLVGRTAK
jgi:hypothetical protein